MRQTYFFQTSSKLQHINGLGTKKSFRSGDFLTTSRYKQLPWVWFISEFAGGKMTISSGIITEPKRCDVFFSRLTKPHSNKLPVFFGDKLLQLRWHGETQVTHTFIFDYLYGWLLPPQIDHLHLPGIPRKWVSTTVARIAASFLFWDEDRQVGVSSPCRLWKFRFSSGSGFWWLLGDENHLLGTLALVVRFKEHFGTAVMMMMMRI